MPEWTYQGWTILIMKNKDIGPWEQKECKRKSREMKDQVLIDKMIMKHAKRKQRN